MQKQLIALLALAVTLSSIFLISNQTQHSTLELYQQWKADYGHSIISSPLEDEYRFKIFEENLKEINEHNGKLGKSYTMGINRFTGLTSQEFTETYLSSFPTNAAYQPTEEASPVNLDVDWVSYGAVSPVKDEGTCLANYAFSAVGAIEGISVIVYKTQQEYSVQEIVDCSSPYGNQGCNGGTMINSFNFVKARGIILFMQASILRRPIPTLQELEPAKPALVYSKSQAMLASVVALSSIMRWLADPFQLQWMAKISEATEEECLTHVELTYR